MHPAMVSLTVLWSYVSFRQLRTSCHKCLQPLSATSGPEQVQQKIAGNGCRAAGLTAFAESSNGGLIVTASAFTRLHRKEIIQWARCGWCLAEPVRPCPPASRGLGVSLDDLI